MLKWLRRVFLGHIHVHTDPDVDCGVWTIEKLRVMVDMQQKGASVAQIAAAVNMPAWRVKLMENTAKFHVDMAEFDRLVSRSRGLP